MEVVLGDRGRQDRKIKPERQIAPHTKQRHCVEQNALWGSYRCHIDRAIKETYYGLAPRDQMVSRSWADARCSLGMVLLRVLPNGAPARS